MLSSQIYGDHPVLRRGVDLSRGPLTAPTNFETSYQHAYFPQRDEPRACSTKSNERPRVCRAPPSVVGSVIEQSKTTMGDCEATTHASYRTPAENKPVRLTKRQNDPKELKPQYPVPVRGDTGGKFSK